MYIYMYSTKMLYKDKLFDVVFDHESLIQIKIRFKHGLLLCVFLDLPLPLPQGVLTLKRVIRMSGGQDPFFTPLSHSTRPPFQHMSVPHQKYKNFQIFC